MNQFDSSWVYLRETPIRSCQSACNPMYGTEYPKDALICTFLKTLQRGNILIEWLLANTALTIVLRGDASIPYFLHFCHPWIFNTTSAEVGLVTMLFHYWISSLLQCPIFSLALSKMKEMCWLDESGTIRAFRASCAWQEAKCILQLGVPFGTHLLSWHLMKSNKDAEIVYFAPRYL